MKQDMPRSWETTTSLWGMLGKMSKIECGGSFVKNFITTFAVGGLAVIGGCTTTVVSPYGMEIDTTNMTDREICEHEVRMRIDRFENTRDWTLSGIGAVAIAEVTRDEDEYWASSPLSVVGLGAFIGYSLDSLNYRNKVNKCVESKKLPEKEDETA